MRNVVISFIVLITISASVMAQSDSVYSFSLKEAQEFAIKNNNNSKNAQLDVEAAKDKVWETTAIGLPHADGSIAGSYTPKLNSAVEQFNSLGLLGVWMYEADQVLHNLDPDNPALGNVPYSAPPEPVDPNDLKWSLNGTFTVSQLIFSGSYLVGLQSAQVYKSLSELNKTKTDQEVVELVTNSYFNVLIAKENKLILDSIYNNLLKTYTDIQAMKKQGFVEDTDVDQMHITVLNVKSSLDMIVRMEDITEKLLKWQLGIGLNEKIKLSDSLNFLVENMSLEQLVIADFVMGNNVDYKLMEASVKSSELLLKLSKSEFLPTVSAFYQYQKEFNDNAFTFTPPHIIGAQVSIPIFASGEKIAKVSQSKINLMKAQNNFTRYSDALMLDYYSTRSEVITNLDNFKAQTINLELSKRIYKNSLIKYSNGMISGLDLNQAQTQFLQTQSDYYATLQNLVKSKDKLEKILSKVN